MTPAEELAAAADKLDALIAAGLTTAPWEVRFQCPEGTHHHDWDEVWLASPEGATVAALNERYTLAPNDAAYIAALNPLVGKELAALMRVSAQALLTVDADDQHDVVADKPGYVPHPLLTIARLINSTNDQGAEAPPRSTPGGD